ncbi:MAG: arsenate reductase ArsC [Planctomycetes bacterium]|nr:arsenate reductase ArsC [Planctomycetota bacterium]
MVLGEKLSILFLCTGNSARSIMAEAIANHLFGERLEACSGGSHPKDAPNPLAIQTLKGHNIETDDLRSKSWNEFRGRGRRFDLVVTLCDSAPDESCPTFPGADTTHWGFPDPPAADDPPAMFETVYQGLVEAIGRFVQTPGEIDQRAAEVAEFIRHRFGKDLPV